MRPGDWDTDIGSSLFDRQRLNNAKKMEFLGQTVLETTVGSDEVRDGRKPLNAKWKAVGGKSQMTHKSENHGKNLLLVYIEICNNKHKLNSFRTARGSKTCATIPPRRPTRHGD